MTSEEDKSTCRKRIKSKDKSPNEAKLKIFCPTSLESSQVVEKLVKKHKPLSKSLINTIQRNLNQNPKFNSIMSDQWSESEENKVVASTGDAPVTGWIGFN